MRNAEPGTERTQVVRRTLCPGSNSARSVPRSAFRVPRSGRGWGGAAVRVGVDVGGTFTDLVALAQDGTIEVRKVVTTPDDPTVGLFRALDPLKTPHAIELLVHGTTIATNALLERRGARVALVTTKGFEDLLWLRRQDRAALYDLARDHSPPLVARSDVVAVAERIGPEGVLEPLGEDEVARVVATVRALRPPPEALAVALLFAFRHAEHERRLVAALRDALPDIPVAASHEVLPVFREFERASTTTVEAYLRPKVSAYLRTLEREVRARGIALLRVMTSSGGTLAPEAAATRAASLALSGPAGGVVGARLVGAAVGLQDLLTLDMGGTSADASLVTGGTPLGDGGGRVAGLALALPAVLIETVSAGGGSIARVDEGGALKVGSVARGFDPRRMALLPFGGAGPLFGCQLAEALGMRTIVIPPHPGALSALGLASAAERVDLLASFHRPLEGLPSGDLGAAFAPLLAEGRSEMPHGVLLRYADCRFAGQGYEVTVPVTGDGAQRIRDAFLVEHRARFGHAGSGQSVELVNLRVVALREGPLPRFADARRVVPRPGARPWSTFCSPTSGRPRRDARISRPNEPRSRGGRRVCAPSRRATGGRQSAARPPTSWTTPSAAPGMPSGGSPPRPSPPRIGSKEMVWTTRTWRSRCASTSRTASFTSTSRAPLKPRAAM